MTAARDIRALVEQVAEVDWTAPAWLTYLAGMTFFDRFARRVRGRADLSDLYAEFLSANGGLRSDTFMARDRPLDGAAPARIARAVVRARAALDALSAVDGALPGQPLDCALAWQHGWLRRAALAAGARRVAFVGPPGVVTAVLAPGSEGPLASALGAWLAGQSPAGAAHPLVPVEAGAAAPTPAALAVVLGRAPVETVRHLHRLAWTAGGGPWLGVGDAPPLEAITTCHLVVDGYGHARLADELFARADRRYAAEGAALAAAAALGLGARDAALDDHRAAGVLAAAPLGFAGAHLDGGGLTFPALAYALGRALEVVYRAHLPVDARRAARFTPTFQVPIAPGAADDPTRRRRRVLHGLLAVRMQDGACEPFDEFRARLRPLLEREAAGEGLLTRSLHAAWGLPVPDTVRRWLLHASGRTHHWYPPVEVLAGRGRLSSLRLDAGERPAAPLYAASAPALAGLAGDPLGGAVLTIVHHDDGATATVSGTGLAAATAGAQRLLDAYREQLASVPESRRRARVVS